jgi:hypothetical protein
MRTGTGDFFGVAHLPEIEGSADRMTDARTDANRTVMPGSSDFMTSSFRLAG